MSVICMKIYLFLVCIYEKSMPVWNQKDISTCLSSFFLSEVEMGKGSIFKIRLSRETQGVFFR